MTANDDFIYKLLQKLTLDPDFKEHFFAATKAPEKEIVSAIEKLLNEEGWEISSEIHEVISKINWHNPNLAEELGARISK